MKKENGVLIKVDEQDIELLQQNPKKFWEDVTEIGDFAFWRCENLTSIKILSSVTKIGNSAFAGCTNLTTIEIPSSITKIGDAAFWCCENLKSIEIPSSVKEIRYCAFFNCSNLTTVKIPNSVTKILNFAFQECKNLKKIKLPKGVELDENVFKDCDRVKIEYYKEKTEQEIANKSSEELAKLGRVCDELVEEYIKSIKKKDDEDVK